MNLIAVLNMATVVSTWAINLISSLYLGNSLFMLQQTVIYPDKKEWGGTHDFYFSKSASGNLGSLCICLGRDGNSMKKTKQKNIFILYWLD